jgi:hypothetical protein
MFFSSKDMLSFIVISADWENPQVTGRKMIFMEEQMMHMLV